jgi:dolichol-phosphate mannosyltransferase
MTHLSVVIPVYNESSLIDELVRRVKLNVKLFTEDFEIIIIDDGSQDNTWNSIEKEAKSENRIRGIKFSRNFGHHYAITAGLHSSNGELVVVMDGDLQDRPEVIPDLYKKAQEGFDVVFVSRQNRPEKLYYRILQKIFYWILNILSGVDFDSSQANFSIISRKVVNAFIGFPENVRFYGSTIKWLGFKRAEIFADHGERFSGSPSYTFSKRITLASDIILAFSLRPLKFVALLGILTSFISALTGIWMIFAKFYWDYAITGWTSLIVSIFFLCGVLLSVLGICAIYIGQIFQQVKNRPLFIIDKSLN